MSSSAEPPLAHGGTRHALSRMARANSQLRPSPPQAPGGRVGVVGGGLVGSCTSYWLAGSGGYDVVVVEAGAGPALGTSKANAGRFCPTIMFDYAPKLGSLKSLVWRDRVGGPGGAASPAGVSGVAWSVDTLAWGTSYLRAATYHYATVNEAMKRLAGLSTAITNRLLHTCQAGETAAHPSSLSADAHVASNPLSVFPNNIWLYGGKEGLANARKLLDLAGDKQSTVESREACARLVPALEKSKVFTSPDSGCAVVRGDFSADARAFATRVQQAAVRDFPDRCKVMYGKQVVKIERRSTSGSSAGWNLILDSGQVVEVDKVVVAGGPFSVRLLQDAFGVHVPILPVRGGSVDLQGVENGPETALADQTSGFLSFQVTPMRNGTVRLVGFADVLGLDAVPAPGQDVACPAHYREALVHRAREVLPNMTWTSEATPWCGLRPMTPDRLPIVDALDPVKFPGVYVNVGHGAMGWTLSGATGWLMTRKMLRADGLLAAHEDALLEGVAREVVQGVSSVEEALKLDRFRWALW